MRTRKTATKIRQEQIVKAALEIIGSEGVSALSIVGIAEKVGIVPSALYRHFESKDDVLDAVLEFIERRLFQNVTLVKKETPIALQRLKSLMKRHARMLSENPAIPHIVLSDGVYRGHPGRKIKVAKIITGYLHRIQKIVEKGKQDGTIYENAVPATTAIMFLGMILPAAVLMNVSENSFDMVAHVENAWPSFARCITVTN